MAKTKKHKFKIGDLVKIAPWCMNKHRQAIVVDCDYPWRTHVMIRFLDGLPDPNQGVTTPCSKKGSLVNIENLVLLSAA